jgi:hypothetical protein
MSVRSMSRICRRHTGIMPVVVAVKPDQVMRQL